MHNFKNKNLDDLLDGFILCNTDNTERKLNYQYTFMEYYEEMKDKYLERFFSFNY